MVAFTVFNHWTTRDSHPLLVRLLIVLIPAFFSQAAAPSPAPPGPGVCRVTLVALSHLPQVTCFARTLGLVPKNDGYISPFLFTLSFVNLENITKCLYSIPTFEVIAYLM